MGAEGGDIAHLGTKQTSPCMRRYGNQAGSGQWSGTPIAVKDNCAALSEPK